MDQPNRRADNRVRLGPFAQDWVLTTMEDQDCSAQDALEHLARERSTPAANGALSIEDKTWIYTTLGECMAETSDTASKQADEIVGRLYAVEEILNLTRLLIAALIEDRGTEEMKEIMRDITSMLDTIIRPLEKSPLQVIEDAREEMRQRNLLLDGQAMRNQEGGDGRETDEMLYEEPDREF